MDDQFHSLTFELLLILFLYLFLFHGSLHSTLSFRVRQIGGGSNSESLREHRGHRAPGRAPARSDVERQRKVEAKYWGSAAAFQSTRLHKPLLARLRL
jgi:hypothetical protein